MGLYLGMLSGTSMDAIDAVIVESHAQLTPTHPHAAIYE
jgi:1,6-anhydro-N-acetylmuramate kinase